MNRDGGVSFDGLVQCRCCENCIKMENELFKENPSKVGSVMCYSCYEELKDNFACVNFAYELKTSVETHTRMKENLKVALGKHDFPINYTSTEWGGIARCITSDGRNVNMAEELNRLEKETLNGVD